MWLEELTIENIKCFEKLSLHCAVKTGPFKWITLLGENGVGKSTVLQSLGLLLAGPEGANQRHQIIVPSLQTPERFTSFLAQFNEDEPLAVFEQWFVHLDYRIAKEQDPVAVRQKELGVVAINILEC